VVKGFKYFTKGASANIFHNLILVRYGITNHDFGLSFRIGEITRVMNAPFTNVKDFELADLLFFKRGYFFLTLWPLRGGSVSGLRGIVLFGSLLQDCDFAFV
jgi:hypothetical protein